MTGQKLIVGSGLAMMGVTLLAGAAHASPLVYDNFSGYATGASVVGDNGGTGWSNAWQNQYQASLTGQTTVLSAPAGFSYTGEPTPTNVMQLNSGYSNATVQVSRAIGATLPAGGSTGTLYFGVLLQRSNTSSSSVFLDLKGSGGGEVQFGYFSSESGSDWALAAVGTGLGGSNGTAYTTTGNAYDSSALTTNTTLLVLELDYNGGSGADSMYLYVDPSTASAPSHSTAAVSDTGMTLQQVNDLLIDDSAPATATDFSNLALGTDYASVVPEPASAAIVMWAGALLACRRHRKASRSNG